jgi:hypothetical protein
MQWNLNFHTLNIHIKFCIRAAAGSCVVKSPASQTKCVTSPIQFHDNLTIISLYFLFKRCDWCAYFRVPYSTFSILLNHVQSWSSQSFTCNSSKLNSLHIWKPRRSFSLWFHPQFLATLRQTDTETPQNRWRDSMDNIGKSFPSLKEIVFGHCLVNRDFVILFGMNADKWNAKSRKSELSSIPNWNSSDIRWRSFIWVNCAVAFSEFRDSHRHRRKVSNSDDLPDHQMTEIFIS